MILINVKFDTKPEWTDRFMEVVADFTASTRNEPGNLWFEWSRSIDTPDQFVLIEAFTDEGAEPHVKSAHFKQAMEDIPPALSATPKIVSHQVDGDGWGEMGEMTVE